MRAWKVAVVLLCAWPGVVKGQALRLTAWGGYESVIDADDWHTTGAQLAWVGSRGHAAWIAGERLRRFGAPDAVVRGGLALHPVSRVWLTLEAGTAAEPVFLPKNSWDVDLTLLITSRVAAGLGYRRQNYVIGPVDMLMPHATLTTAGVSWDLRVFLSRNPSERIDGAGLLRITLPVSRRASAWIGAGAGRESYVVGLPPVQQVRSLDTVTGSVGVRLEMARGLNLRVDATVIRSEPVLSRRGGTAAIEWRW
jgi:YaiO family outer membrane protein